MSLDNAKDEYIADLETSLESVLQINRQLTEHLEHLKKHPQFAAMLVQDSAEFYDFKTLQCHLCRSTAAQAFQPDQHGAGPRCDPNCHRIQEHTLVLPASDAKDCIKPLPLKKLGECTIVVRFIRHSDRENMPVNTLTRFARQRAFIISKRNCIYSESENGKPVIPGVGAVLIASEMFVKSGSALTSIVHHVIPPRHTRSGFAGPQNMLRYLRLMLELGIGVSLLNFLNFRAPKPNPNTMQNAAICVDCPTDLTVCPGHLREFLEFFSSAERRRISIVVRKAGQLNTCRFDAETTLTTRTCVPSPTLGKGLPMKTQN